MRSVACPCDATKTKGLINILEALLDTVVECVNELRFQSRLLSRNRRSGRALQKNICDEQRRDYHTAKLNHPFHTQTPFALSNTGKSFFQVLIREMLFD